MALGVAASVPSTLLASVESTSATRGRSVSTSSTIFAIAPGVGTSPPRAVACRGLDSQRRGGPRRPQDAERDIGPPVGFLDLEDRLRDVVDARPRLTGEGGSPYFVRPGPRRPSRAMPALGPNAAAWKCRSTTRDAS